MTTEDVIALIKDCAEVYSALQSSGVLKELEAAVATEKQIIEKLASTPGFADLESKLKTIFEAKASG